MLTIPNDKMSIAQIGAISDIPVSPLEYLSKKKKILIRQFRSIKSIDKTIGFINWDNPILYTTVLNVINYKGRLN